MPMAGAIPAIALSSHLGRVFAGRTGRLTSDWARDGLLPVPGALILCLLRRQEAYGRVLSSFPGLEPLCFKLGSGPINLMGCECPL